MCTLTFVRKDYQSLVGALPYASINTRPDIAYAVSMLCRAMAKPTEELYGSALRVIYCLHHLIRMWACATVFL